MTAQPTPPAETPRTDAAKKLCFECFAHNKRDGDSVTADFARTLERELAAVTAERDALQLKYDNAFASGIHSCGDHCQRPLCVLRRERDRLRKALKQIEDEAYDAIEGAERPHFDNYERLYLLAGEALNPKGTR